MESWKLILKIMISLKVLREYCKIVWKRVLWFLTPVPIRKDYLLDNASLLRIWVNFSRLFKEGCTFYNDLYKYCISFTDLHLQGSLKSMHASILRAVRVLVLNQKMTHLSYLSGKLAWNFQSSSKNLLQNLAKFRQVFKIDELSLN